MRDEMSADDELVFAGEIIVIPESMRSDMLEVLHEPHTGMDKTKSRVRSAILAGNVESNREHCLEVQNLHTVRPEQSEEDDDSTRNPRRPVPESSNGHYVLQMSILPSNG